MYYELPNSLFYPNYLEVGLETLQITLMSPVVRFKQSARVSSSRILVPALRDFSIKSLLAYLV
jgi:hypothetical protein